MVKSFFIRGSFQKSCNQIVTFLELGSNPQNFPWKGKGKTALPKENGRAVQKLTGRHVEPPLGGWGVGFT